MRRYAITVGVQEYALGGGVAPLQYACADAEAIGNALREHCRFDEVRILTTSSTANGQLTDTSILTTLRDMAGRLNEDDLFLFFFAGHGVEQQVGGQHRSFLLAPNASLQFMTGLLDLAMLREIMARMACSQRVFLLDCCRNDPLGGRGDAGNPMTERLTRDIVAAAMRPHTDQTNRVTLVMNACRPGERSYERPDVGHGAFSHWLVQGLRGEAWTDEGLEGAQLCRYVESSLTDWSQRTGLRQHADFQQLESASVVWLAGAGALQGAPRPPAIMPPPPQPVRPVELHLGNAVTIPLRLVTRGEFQMGASVDDSGAFSNERPQHRVRITRDFLVGERPVSCTLWNAVMTANLRQGDNKDAPVSRVSWDDAQAFIARLNQLIDDGQCKLEGSAGQWTVRLPTEAEWEYAASVLGPDVRPDWIGLCWQWCEDWYGPYRHGLAIDTQGSLEGTERVLRGASPSTDRRFLRPTARGHRPPDTRQQDIGFRIVLVRGAHD
jgi:formylglycine-generating enzyme required for sulfatase activity